MIGRPASASILTLLALSLAWLSAAPPVGAQDAKGTEESLRRHGVATDSEGLARFLAMGWQGAQPPKPLPVRPSEKISLLVESWVLLTLRYDEVHQPGSNLEAALGLLAQAYAEGHLPPGVEEMLDRDVASLEGANRSARRAALARLLHYNGMVALGFYGVADGTVRAAARKKYDEETEPAARVAYGRTLALLGDQAVLADLAVAVKSDDRQASIPAADALGALFGRSFGLRTNQAIGPRKQGVKELLAWWDGLAPEAKTVDRAAAIGRLLTAPPQPPATSSTVRDLLRRSADKADFSDARGSRSAWTALAKMGKNLLPELEPILANVDEDLDIRGEAMQWFARLKGSDASSRLKKLRKDPNPEIAQLAKTLTD